MKQPATKQPQSNADGRLLKNVEVSTLCAFYGGLLTPRQQEALLLHYDEDFSLGEIAEQFGVSRQNIHDLVTRSVQKLQRCEDAVGGVAQAQGISQRLAQAQEDLARAQGLSTGQAEAHIGGAMAQITQIMNELNGGEGTRDGI